MKIAMIIVRTLMGVLFIFSGVTFFLGLVPAQTMEPGSAIEKFNLGLASVGYFFPVLKSVELICGLLFVIGRAVPFATILIAPVIVHIALYDLLVDRTPPLPYIAVFLILANLLVAWYYRRAYTVLFTATAKTV